MKITRSLLSGVAIAAILIGGVTFGFVSTRMSSSGIHEFKIVFPTADGLVSGSDVLVAGSKVGTISDIEPTQNDQAMVTVGVAGDQWPLHRGLTADIRPKSLLGQGGNDRLFTRDTSADQLFGGSGADSADSDALDSRSSIESSV